MSEAVSYRIETEVSEAMVGNLLDFIDHKYLSPRRHQVTDVSRGSITKYSTLTFSLLTSAGEPEVRVDITGSRPLEIHISRLTTTVSQKRMDEVKQDLFIIVQHFEEHVRKSTLYFAWREGAEIVPEKVGEKEKKAINRLFLETQIFLSIIFISLSLILFIFLDVLAPLLLIALQLIFVFYSTKIVARIGDWEITPANPNIHLIQYHLPTTEYDHFQTTFSREKVTQIKKDVYEQTLAQGRSIDCKTAHKVFVEHGFACKEENLLAKTVNVHQMVQETTEQFGLPMPRIVVANSMIPNATASGPSPRRGLVLLTTGLLVQLEEDEVRSVLGHEFSHLKSRDPLILFGLIAVEFLFRFYAAFFFFPAIFSFPIFFVYFWLVMGLIYFIAKIFEAKCDLVSAMVIGQPKVLAEALEKIGFRRLQYERSPAYRLQKWIGWEPHPPVSFRVNRLRKLKEPIDVKHPLLQSIADVIHGFLRNF